MGASELILVLLSLSNFGVDSNPSAPTAAEIMRYAPDGADAMVYIDVETLLPRNWKVLKALPENPILKAAPEMRQQISEMVQQAESARSMLSAQWGIDPMTAIKSVAIFWQWTPKGGRQLVVIRGSFPAGIAEKAGYLNMAAVVTADGTLVAGDPAWVKQRGAASWKPSGKGALASRAGVMLDETPVAFMATAPSATAARGLLAKIDNFDAVQTLIRDLIAGGEFAALSLRATGLSWTYRARAAGGFARAVDATEGAISLIRAHHLAWRGLARITLAALPSYSKAPQIAALVRRRADILLLVEDWSGDGMFKVEVDKRVAERTISVRASARTLSQVVPMVGLLVPAGAAWFMLGKTAPPAPRPVQVMPAHKPKAIPTPGRKPQPPKPSNGHP